MEEGLGFERIYVEECLGFERIYAEESPEIERIYAEESPGLLTCHYFILEPPTDSWSTFDA